MNYFRHVYPHDLRYLGPVSPNLDDVQIPYRSYNLTQLLPLYKIKT